MEKTADSSVRQHLQKSYEQLSQVCDSINAFTPSNHVYQPPIIDNHETRYAAKEISGLAKFRGICEKESDWLEELTHASQPPVNLSTNAPYLISVWNEVLACTRPLISIGETFRSPRGDRVKVDVTGKGGLLWIKVNTIKLSRLLLEFREQDSYVNSDYDSSDAEDPVLQEQAAAYPITPINSITKQCYDLVQTAARQRTPWGATPKIQLRLTRLTGDEKQDERLQKTYECLRGMGVDVVFGEIGAESKSSSPAERNRPIRPPTLLATPKLNLDLSLLIALISDISHAPLPRNEDEAENRFKPIDKAWKRHVDPVTGQVSVKKLQEGELGAEEHSKALVYQLRQEMRLGLIDELNETIAASCEALDVPVDQVEFYTTAEAKRRCHDIVAKIGGEQERRREEMLFFNNSQPDDGGSRKNHGSAFWEESRHVDQRKPLNRTLRVKILPEDDNFTCPSFLQGHAVQPNTFRGRLTETCTRLLSVNIEKGSSVTADFLGLSIADSPASSDAEFGDDNGSSVAGRGKKLAGPHRGGRRRREAPLAETNLRVPTAHTIRSMLEGSRRGMTTITANRMSVKQILRAMGPLEALEQDENVVTASVASRRDVAEALFYVVEPKTLGEIKRSDTTSLPSSDDMKTPGVPYEEGKQETMDRTVENGTHHQSSAFWVLEPRSLAENLRQNPAEDTIGM
ncbi:hypothetical protein QFC22_005109 [Naganishia vaughanmartiniae]|uniref:Uncharacterized protein n=1 Tax=Naganishia vaughanmartiniae TaxID=1424756 RepID=A0ACC2WXU6_9TREE|nr:hypothetical protein QFC22_005109 [Naganishia vaughanmartiniae]